MERKESYSIVDEIRMATEEAVERLSSEVGFEPESARHLLRDFLLDILREILPELTELLDEREYGAFLLRLERLEASSMNLRHTLVAEWCKRLTFLATDSYFDEAKRYMDQMEVWVYQSYRILNTDM